MRDMGFFGTIQTDRFITILDFLPELDFPSSREILGNGWCSAIGSGGDFTARWVMEVYSLKKYTCIFKKIVK